MLSAYQMNKVISGIKLNNDSIQELLELYNKLKHYDEYTAFHSYQVACIGLLIGQKVMNQKDHLQLFLGGLLHDIGKLSFPISLLKGRTKPTDTEKIIIKQHPSMGYNIVKPFTSSEIILQMILQHHENYDGTGYPNKLKGEQLPIHSRIARIADMISALTTFRNYRDIKKYSVATALEIIESQKEQFDSDLLCVLNTLNNEAFEKFILVPSVDLNKIV